MPNENQPPPPVNKMGLDELRIKVAELCGWKKDSRGWWFPPNENGLEYTHPPNFPSDLNACAEMREELSEDEWYAFVDALLGKPWTSAWDWDDVVKLVSAPADDQCRAFVAVRRIRLAPHARGIGAKLAREYEVSQTVVSGIRNGSRWKQVVATMEDKT